MPHRDVLAHADGSHHLAVRVALWLDAQLQAHRATVHARAESHLHLRASLPTESLPKHRLDATRRLVFFR